MFIHSLQDSTTISAHCASSPILQNGCTKRLVRHALLARGEDTSKQLQNHHESSICMSHIQEDVCQKYSQGERTAGVKPSGQWRTVKNIKEAQAGRKRVKGRKTTRSPMAYTMYSQAYQCGTEFTTNKNNHIVTSKRVIVGKFILKPSLWLGCICAKIKKKML